MLDLHGSNLSKKLNYQQTLTPHHTTIRKCDYQKYVIRRYSVSWIPTWMEAITRRAVVVLVLGETDVRTWRGCEADH